MSNIIASFFRSTFDQTKVPDLTGRVYVATGGSNGIGLSVARTLYSHGATVHILSSQKVTGDAAVDYIRTGDLDKAPADYKAGFGSQKDNSANGATKDGSVDHTPVDFGDLNAVAKVAKNLAGLPRLDGFLGIAGLGVKDFELTGDGYDRHLTVNALSHVLLLSHLLPLLEKTSKEHSDSDVRIVLEASELHRATFGGPSEKYGGTKFADEEEFRKDVGPNSLYARTKLADILIVKAIVEKYLQPPSKILAYSVHPGGVATGQQEQFKAAYGETLGNIAQAVFRPLFRAPDDGALSTIWAATGPSAREGDFENGGVALFLSSTPKQDGKESNEATDPEIRENFWRTSLGIIKKVVGPDNVGSFA
ncbi:hypothetical protein JCM10207_003256 [Rhodosporidiobolus poonsookiae]